LVGRGGNEGLPILRKYFNIQYIIFALVIGVFPFMLAVKKENSRTYKFFIVSMFVISGYILSTVVFMTIDVFIQDLKAKQPQEEISLQYNGTLTSPQKIPCNYSWNIVLEFDKNDEIQEVTMGDSDNFKIEGIMNNDIGLGLNHKIKIKTTGANHNTDLIVKTLKKSYYFHLVGMDSIKEMTVDLKNQSI
jgi:hypothetical protein